MPEYHVIERISPKGTGLTFIGYCIRCGRMGLKAADALKKCDNPSGMTNEQALIACIEGPS